jgi:(p)ppGpp synthase/HD superfamily hydrolase
MEKVAKARAFAIAAHSAAGQVRKYTGEPYHVHPAEVAQIVTARGGDQAQICAAWLHDVVEDTAVTIELIETEFGKDVAELVGWLTDVSKPEDGNRAERKAIDRKHTAQAPKRAKFVKLADLISNTSSIVEHDAKFAKVYLAEKRLLIREAFADMDGEIFLETCRQLRWGEQHLARLSSKE